MRWPRRRPNLHSNLRSSLSFWFPLYLQSLPRSDSTPSRASLLAERQARDRNLMKDKSSFSFRESCSITMTNRRLLTRTTAAQPGRTSHCKVFIRVWWGTACKASITSVRAKSCGYLRNSKSKRWPQSANLDQKKHCMKNCRRAKVPTTAAKFPRAFSKGLSYLDKLRRSLSRLSECPLIQVQRSHWFDQRSFKF